MSDEDGPACYREREVRARHAHRCYECHETIPPGTTYTICSGVWEGRGASFKWCQSCVALRDELDELVEGDFLFNFGNLLERAHEVIQDTGDEIKVLVRT